MQLKPRRRPPASKNSRSLGRMGPGQLPPANWARIYEKETGIKVNVVQEPWGTFYDSRELPSGPPRAIRFDMVVGDSQWLGQGATQGHYVDLTDFMTSNGIDKTVTPATLKYYGEYPAARASTGPTRPKATPTAGPIARTCSKTPTRWPPSRPNTATTWPCPRPGRSCATSPSSSPARMTRSVRRRRLHPEGLRRHHHGLRERDVQLRRRLV